MVRTPRKPPANSFSYALAALQKGALHPLYFLHGPETILRDEFLRAIRRTIFGEEVNDFSYDRIDWSGGKGADVAAAARTLPFMSGKRLVEVRGLETVGEADDNALLPLIEDPSSDAVVVFMAEKPDLRTRFFRRLKDAAQSVPLETPGDRELPAWLKIQAESLGFRLTGEAALMLVQVVEPSLGRFHSGFVGAGGTAGEEEVREVVGRSRVEAIYKLGSVLAAGDTAGAVRLVRHLMENEVSPIQLLGLLRNQIRQWTIAKAAAQRRMNAGELASLLHIPLFAAERLQREVSSVSARFFRSLPEKLLAADRRMKRTSGERAAERALEMFFLEVAQTEGAFETGRGTPPSWGLRV
ncbi:MAG: DNA polymerase III subunit delta [bacterium]|nr:DNA polymerase III subunit delta [bacterium]